MVLTRFGDRGRRKRQAWGTVFRWCLWLGAIAAAVVYAYNTGRDVAGKDTSKLETTVVELRTAIAGLETDRDALTAKLAGAEQALAEAAARYQRDVPQGPVKDLAAQVTLRLAEGLDPERLAFVLDHVRNKQACDAAPQTKRFIVQTPLGTGANASVGFGDGTITVTGVGESAVDGLGNPLAQFDPARPITLRFTSLSGQATRATGTLPLNHTLVDGASEYRFAAVQGSTGFVAITALRCAFP